MGSIKDLINLSKDIYNDISDIICCPDKRCLCDPTNQFRRSSKFSRQNQQRRVSKRTFGKSSEDYEVKRLNELKASNNELVRINKQLIKMRGIIQHQDEDSSNFSNLLLLQRDVAYQKNILFLIEEKLRGYM
ncbi:uncharacterized protein LOC123291517 [Chrysoperla carnea]|uniref:uncharacterized protein LOC123291517 n=1 Tax=Chrysoperla carnea TaxID=189513 RepID=UPI001D09322C|nr:uncharacterized protein LOC123291517 [Chrysoperla carnea]